MAHHMPANRMLADRMLADRMLEGVRVLDVADGSAATELVRILADLGASVTRILPGANGTGAADDTSLTDDTDADLFGDFPTLTTLALDLERADGRDSFDPLLATADILIETRAPGRLGGLGYGAARREALNPRLVQCQIGRACQDPDRTDSLAAATLLLAALFARGRDGKGRTIDVDPLTLDGLGMGSAVEDELPEAFGEGAEPPPLPAPVTAGRPVVLPASLPRARIIASAGVAVTAGSFAEGAQSAGTAPHQPWEPRLAAIKPTERRWG